ncbi:helicase-exonuclease AddAB subunit AddA [Clostridium neuense]|uniref:ATP-dependent helicase/nuclease subunit A n=1 Tax=Clostridium neuense TaxID=1728934 RepID=A0ABW8TJW8_9CLOT
MSKSMWTDEQLEAINSRGSNLLVAAAAGSGKTAVLVERIIKIITDEENPVDIDRLLVVTFTNAAASEMRERIGKAISEKLYKNPNSKTIQRQLALLNKAKITTIHSFCLDVIKNNFHYIDIDPDFRVGDETEMVLLKNETLEELFDEKYLKAQENSNSMFFQLLESYCSNKNDSVLFETVMNLYNFAMSNPWPYEWINSMVEKFNIDENFEFGKSEWAQVLLANIKMELAGLKRASFNALNIIENEPTLESYAQTYKEELNMLDNLISSCDDYNKLYKALSGVSFNTLKRCGKDVNKEKQKLVKDIRDNVKKKLNDIAMNITSRDGTSIKNEISKLYPLMKALGELVIEFNEKYRRNKSKKNTIDFNDFEHMCLDILTEKDEENNIKPSRAALEIREKYDEILIDEYQDSNLVQEVIMGTISKKYTDNPNLFMVGDVKQSIYRFRKANPRLFLEKYNTYEKDENCKNRKILLYKNFRSRKEILDGVNFIFKQIMSPTVGEMDYTVSEFLNLGANYKEFDLENEKINRNIELYVIEKSKEETQEEDEEDISDIMLEARVVGKKILDMVQNSEEDKSFFVFDKEKNSYRKARYKDIVILLRSTKKWSTVFSEELKRMGIPVFADSNSGYFENPEIKTMLSLLQVIDNPMQDIPFAAVLRSPIGGFSVEELIDIKSFEGDTFYEKFLNGKEACDEKVENKLCMKISYFIDKLIRWRKEALYMPIDEFIWHLYTETGYYGYVGAVKGGMQRQANLRMLFQKAKVYSETSYKGLFNFINFINKIKVSSGDMGSAKILGENEDVVRIMSIHKSKGLEFPIVFVSGAGKNFNLMDMNKTILFHNELGFGPDYVDLEKRVSYGTLMKEAIKNKIKLETLSEEMRILYVAFTRAKEKLIITGLTANLEKAALKWASAVNISSEKISEDVIIKGKSYLDWICTSLIRHKDASILREAAGKEIENSNFICDESKWEVSLLKRSEAIGLWNNEEDEKLDKLGLFYTKLEEIKNSPHESCYYGEIERRLNYKYKYKKAAKLPSLLSVTELKRQFSEEEEYGVRMFMPSLAKKPTFLEQIKGLTAAEKGTVFHSVMQHLNFYADGGKIDMQGIKAQIDNMVASEIITDKQAETVNAKKILKFLNSDIGKRVLAAEKVYKEFPFQVRIKSTDIYKELEKDLYENENIIVQGIIDLYFEEEDGIVLLDYKTDYVTDEDMDNIKKRYKMQIDYYGAALETITGIKVKEKYLYLFYNGITVKM